jgi:hypothetical protein
MAFRLTSTPVFRVLFPAEFQLYKPTPGEEATYSIGLSLSRLALRIMRSERKRWRVCKW